MNIMVIYCIKNISNEFPEYISGEMSKTASDQLFEVKMKF